MLRFPRSLDAVFFAGILVLVSGCAGCNMKSSNGSNGTSQTKVPKTKPSETKPSDGGKMPVKPIPEETVIQITRFCGNCHKMPDPATNPKEEWPREVDQGFALYDASLRTDLVRPPVQETIRYFREQAPDELKFDTARDLPNAPAKLKFTPQALPEDEVNDRVGVSQVHHSKLRNGIITSDMFTGEVRFWSLTDRWHSTLMAQGENVCRITEVDWDNDGGQDLLMAELGSFPAQDHSNGRLRLLKQDGDGFRSFTLVEKLGRTVEALPFDYDEDGDLDIVVAEFGWRATGSLFLLRNKGTTGDQPEFEKETLDHRHGALGVELADINGDGKRDLLVAFGQEVESVEIFYNRGNGKFDQKVIRDGQDPSFGSSWVTAVDLDQDGKLDLLHSNGDSLDRFLPRPYHGVRWLRNNGNGTFDEHFIGKLPGASQVTAGDIDGDGDLDVVAVSILFGAQKNAPKDTFDSVVWFEQQANHQWGRHTVERDTCEHAAVALVDYDGDGRLDIVTGSLTERVDPKKRLTVYRNEALKTK